MVLFMRHNEILYVAKSKSAMLKHFNLKNSVFNKLSEMGIIKSSPTPFAQYLKAHKPFELVNKNKTRLEMELSERQYQTLASLHPSPPRTLSHLGRFRMK